MNPGDVTPPASAAQNAAEQIDPGSAGGPPSMPICPSFQLNVGGSQTSTEDQSTANFKDRHITDSTVSNTLFNSVPPNIPKLSARTSRRAPPETRWCQRQTRRLDETLEVELQAHSGNCFFVICQNEMYGIGGRIYIGQDVKVCTLGVETVSTTKIIYLLTFHNLPYFIKHFRIVSRVLICFYFYSYICFVYICITYYMYI